MPVKLTGRKNEAFIMRIGRYESSEGSNVGTAITFLLIGLGAGALAGLLLAPKSGKALRRVQRLCHQGAFDHTANEQQRDGLAGFTSADCFHRCEHCDLLWQNSAVSEAGIPAIERHERRDRISQLPARDFLRNRNAGVAERSAQRVDERRIRQCSPVQRQRVGLQRRGRR